jgi:hypothetical protein
MFSTQSNDSNGALTIKAHSYPPSDTFINIMNFSTGELNFNSHFKNEDISLRSGLNATWQQIKQRFLSNTTFQ